MRLIRDLSFYHLQEPKWVCLCQSNFVYLESGHSPGNHLESKIILQPKVSLLFLFFGKIFSSSTIFTCTFSELLVSLSVLNTLDKKRDGRGSVAIENCFGRTFFLLKVTLKRPDSFFFLPQCFPFPFFCSPFPRCTKKVLFCKNFHFFSCPGQLKN